MRAGKENLNNQLPRSLGLQAHDPFRDITNVADCRQSLEDKSGCVQASSSAQGFVQSVGDSVARTQHSVNPFAVYSDHNTSSIECRGAGPTNALEKKRYNNRERYFRMTPEQRDVYLQRNREYKRSRRQNHDTYSDGMQSAVSHTSRSSNGGTNSSTQTSKKTKVAATGDPSMPPSDKIIFQESLVNLVIGRQIMLNPSVLSTSHCTSETTVSQKQIPTTYLINSGEDNIRRSSDGASCSTATQSSMYRKRRCGHVSTIVGKDKQAATYLDMGNDYKRRRLSNGGYSSASQFSCGTACCITAQKENGYTCDLLDQYVPVQMQHHVTREQEDHDNTIYTPRDNFPAVQDETRQDEDMAENSDEDEEGNVFLGQGFEYLSYRELNRDICGTQVDLYDRIYQNLPAGHHVLKPMPNCIHCNAKRFQFEKPTFCCMGGRVKIVIPHVPAEMRRLYTSQDPEAKYFQDNIRLKINCPVILIRNLDPSNGLCNGTRLIIKAFQDNAIDAEIIGGHHAGKRVFLPRIPLYPSEDDVLPFKFKRKQFPICLSFAMTINKAQGQTIPNVGIYLSEPVFSHGQLYVALSRGVSRHTTRILAKPSKDIDPSGKNTKNIVYKDVLLC